MSLEVLYAHIFVASGKESCNADVELNGPEEMGVRVQVKVLTYPENVAKSEDEES